MWWLIAAVVVIAVAVLAAHWWYESRRQYEDEKWWESAVRQRDLRPEKLVREMADVVLIRCRSCGKAVQAGLSGAASAVLAAMNAGAGKDGVQPPTIVCADCSQILVGELEPLQLGAAARARRHPDDMQ